MKAKISILYSWLIKTLTYFLPNHPLFMRFRGWLYSFMMEACGKDFQVASTATINSLVGLKVGRNVYIAHNTVIIGLDITIGDEAIIGPSTIISAGNHIFNKGSFRFGKSDVKAVVIAEGTWISGNCSVIGGSVLPKQSILAAGAVLNKEFIEEKTIYGGVPAKKIGIVT